MFSLSPVLCSHMWALFHALRRVVGIPEYLEQLLERDLRRLIDDANNLHVIGATGTDLVISWVTCVPADESYLMSHM